MFSGIQPSAMLLHLCHQHVRACVDLVTQSPRDAFSRGWVIFPSKGEQSGSSPTTHLLLDMQVINGGDWSCWPAGFQRESMHCGELLVVQEFHEKGS